MTNLSELPFEILTEIAKRVPPQDLESLRHSNGWIWKGCASVFGKKFETFARSMSKEALEEVQKCPPGVTTHIRTLFMYMGHDREERGITGPTLFHELPEVRSDIEILHRTLELMPRLEVLVFRRDEIGPRNPPHNPRCVDDEPQTNGGDPLCCVAAVERALNAIVPLVDAEVFKLKGLRVPCRMALRPRVIGGAEDKHSSETEPIPTTILRNLESLSVRFSMENWGK